MPLKKTEFVQPQSNQQIEQLTEKISELTQKLSTKQSEIDNLGQSVLKLNDENERLLKLSKSESELNERNNDLQKKLNQNEQERKRLSTIATECQDKTRKALARAEYAETHQKTVTEYVDKVRTEYKEKCQDCSKEKYQSLLTATNAKNATLKGYVVSFAGITLLTTIFSIIRQKVFCGDFIAFWVGVWKLLTTCVKSLNGGILKLSEVSQKINNAIGAGIVKWLIIILIWGIVMALIGFAGYKLMELLSEKIGDWVSGWNFSLSVLLLVIAVYFGDYVKSLISFNLFGLWLIIDVILIGAGAYWNSCKQNRGY